VGVSQNACDLMADDQMPVEKMPLIFSKEQGKKNCNQLIHSYCDTSELLRQFRVFLLDSQPIVLSEANHARQIRLNNYAADFFHFVAPNIVSTVVLACHVKPSLRTLRVGCSLSACQCM
jgi:hypothetical protein